MATAQELTPRVYQPTPIGANVVQVPLKGYVHDLEAMADAVAGMLRCEQARLYYVDAAADAVWCTTPAGDGAERLSLPIDDSWMRDTGPDCS